MLAGMKKLSKITLTTNGRLAQLHEKKTTLFEFCPNNKRAVLLKYLSKKVASDKTVSLLVLVFAFCKQTQTKKIIISVPIPISN